jgi:radical SAM superfamily enzyme YgiQ (UPF0313 family)
MKPNTGTLRFRIIVPAYPAFNIYSRIARKTTALGPVMVATVVSRMGGWNVEVIDENNYRKLGPKDDRGLADHGTLQTIRAADVVGVYGGLSSTIPRLYEVTQFYKKQGVTTIAGGQHFIGENIRDALDNGIDFVVAGEGEETIRELLTVIRDGGRPEHVPGIFFMQNGRMIQTPERPPITDFDSLPLADFDLVRYAKISIYPINWIRGCGMDCEFCTVKGQPRSASVERIVEQIALLVETHNARHFFILDDLFGQRRKETLRLCRLLTAYQNAVGIRLDLTVQIRLDRAKDAELLQSMREACINTVCIGFESPIAEELAAMNKRVRPEDMLEMARRYHKAGFLVHGMFIFGYPVSEGVRLHLSTREQVRQFKTFIRKGRLDTIQVLLPVPLPGTELTKRLAAQDRIFTKNIVGWEYYDGNFPLFQPDDPLTPEEMHAALRKIMGRFYRFRYMFAIGLNVLIFPAMILSVFRFRVGWRKWHRLWRNALKRFGGWIILRHWTTALKQSKFSEKLIAARQRLQASEPKGSGLHS